MGSWFSLVFTRSGTGFSNQASLVAGDHDPIPPAVNAWLSANGVAEARWPPKHRPGQMNGESICTIKRDAQGN